MPNLNQELSNHELSMLNDFLRKATKDAKFNPDIFWLDGYLCAIISSVQIIPTSKWLEKIKDKNFKFETTEQKEAVNLLLTKFYNRVNEATNSEIYIPIYTWNKFKHFPQLETARRWAKGYLLGTIIASEGLLELREIKVILMSIIIVAGAIPDHELDEDISRKEMVDKIPKAVKVILKIRNAMREHILEHNLLAWVLH